jgi:subtilisin family serine protease
MTGRVRRVSPVLFFLLLVTSSAAPLAAGGQTYGDVSVMDASLQRALAEGGASDVHKVIVQFTTPLGADVSDVLEEHDATVLGTAPLVDGHLIEASDIDLRRLSTNERVRYMELDRPLEFFYLPSAWGGAPEGDVGAMMHDTVHVIDAVDAWHRVVVQPDGRISYDLDLGFTEWDGDGTAIVDLDTGVDAGHPDYDYLEPWAGDKTLYSAKFNGQTWVETRNSDTSSGHGTHVGGTIAGNGDASAGRRAGVAKGAQLIALGTGDGASIFAAEQGLEWTYEHSRPGSNEYHIRVVSNSWGTDGDYDPQGVIARLTDMLTYDHGVAVIFAASNSGGSGAECSGDLRTNVYANTPSAISIAALTHDGTAVTSFSSRGCMAQQHTWPDLGAPGRNIWATAPRGTAIDASTRTQGDLYYMSISGTSMATPHIGGVAGLLLDVAPSLRAATYHSDDHDQGDSIVMGDGTAAYGQFDDWEEAKWSKVHEVELILELTARYEGLGNSCEDGNDEDTCSDIPSACYRSATGGCHDWRVGHGLVDVDEAMALARTLQILRDPNLDGFIDHPDFTVWDAWEIYSPMLTERTIPVDTDRVRHQWKGDWNHFNNGQNGAVYSTNDAHHVFVPNGTTTLVASFVPTEWDLDTGQVGGLQLRIDMGEDGNNDAQGLGQRSGDTWTYTLDVDPEHWGTWTEFDVEGQAVVLWGFLDDPEFFEASIPYTVDVVLTLDLSEPRNIAFEQRSGTYTDLDPTTPSDAYTLDMSGRLTFTRPVFDQQAVADLAAGLIAEAEDGEDGFFSALLAVFTDHAGASLMLLILLLVGAVGAGYAISASRIDAPRLLNIKNDEILDAELEASHS